MIAFSVYVKFPVLSTRVVQSLINNHSSNLINVVLYHKFPYTRLLACEYKKIWPVFFTCRHMAGHAKWQNVKHVKAERDRAKAVLFNKYIRLISAAVRGADRLELCQNLSVGGLTPTAGLISVVKKTVSVPVFVLIRSRPGNFHYTTYEVDQMLEDIKISKQMGADGLVFGALNKNHEVDVNVCQQILDESSDLPVTFHRAFDEIVDKTKALETVIQLGFKRILTSGGSDAAEAEVETLKNLVSLANGRIIVMPGGNVNDDNISRILQITNAVEFHSSGRGRDPNSPSKKSSVCSDEIIKNMKKILDSTPL